VCFSFLHANVSNDVCPEYRLSKEEKALAEIRLAGDNSSHGSHVLTWTEAKETLVDWRLYLHYLAYIGISAPFSSLSLFAPTIVAGLDYKGMYVHHILNSFAEAHVACLIVMPTFSRECFTNLQLFTRPYISRRSEFLLVSCNLDAISKHLINSLDAVAWVISASRPE
jgi:hypothetical protein